MLTLRYQLFKQNVILMWKNNTKGTLFSFITYDRQCAVLRKYAKSNNRYVCMIDVSVILFILIVSKRNHIYFALKKYQDYLR